MEVVVVVFLGVTVVAQSIISFAVVARYLVRPSLIAETLQDAVDGHAVDLSGEQAVDLLVAQGRLRAI
jgi:hypothetical protein